MIIPCVKTFVITFVKLCCATICVKPCCVKTFQFLVCPAQGRGERAHVGVRASYRSLSHILQQEGWRALYQGVGPASFAGSLSWGLYFTVYNSSKTAYARMYFGGSGSGGSGGSANGAGGSANGSGSAGGENRKEDIPSVYLLLAGLKAGVATLAVTHPLWLIKLRMQLQQRNLSSSSSSDTAHLTCYRNTFGMRVNWCSLWWVLSLLVLLLFLLFLLLLLLLG